MIKLLHGNDEFSTKEKLENLIGDKKDPELDLNIVYSTNVSFNNYKEYIHTISLFSGRRILVFHDLVSKIIASKSDDWKDFIEVTLNKPNVNEVIFVESKEINLRSNKVSNISDMSEIFLFNIPTGRGSWEKIKLWIAERQKFHNINISQAGVNKLIDLIGSNYRYLDNELIKLSNYKLDQTIDDKDVEIMVSGIRESSIFELIDSILEKNIISASKLLDQMISNGQNFFSIQQMLSRQVRLIIMTQNLIQINDPKEIQKKIQVNSSFAFNKILNQSKQFSNKRMKDILKNLLQLDIDIKSGNKTEKEILEKLVYIL